MIEIRYSHGREETVNTLVEAFEKLTREYPHAVFCNQFGDDLVYPEAHDEAELQEEGARILVWRDEESSVNDDGARAIASLRYVG